MKVASNCTRPKYVCGNDKIKLTGTTDGYFPDFGHHLEKEMGGLWLYPVKLIDGFWMRFKDEEAKTVDTYILADRFENYPHKNVFHYNNGMGHTPITITRTQVAPDGLKGIRVEYEIKSPLRNNIDRHIELDFLTRVNLRPDWLAEELGIFDGDQDKIVYSDADHAFIAQDNENPWSVMVGCSENFDSYSIENEYGPEVTCGNGASVKMHFSYMIKPGEVKKLAFYFAGSLVSVEENKEAYQQIAQAVNCEQEKEKRLVELMKQTKLDVGDDRFETIFDWVKVHTDWLTLEVDGVGRGVAAGLPEYAWWFGCDSCYALQGMMMQGNFELCKNTIELLVKYSRQYNGNGKIVHEILPNSFSPNFGNTQETAHFLYLLWAYYQWTGDKETLASCFDYLTMGVTWLKEQDDDNDYFPTGYGIIEIAGLNMEMIDTAAYTAVAYECYANICKLFGKEDEASEWMDLAVKAQKAVHDDFWLEEEGLFGDCFASTEKIEQKKQMIMDQMEESGDEASERKFLAELAKASDKKAEKCWLLNKNWVVNVPLEVGIADEHQAKMALKRLHTSEFIGQYGMYLEGLRRNATMSISTGVMAVAQARYGYSDRALELIQRLMKSFSMATPGSISEMSPDYGCYVQAWTAYGIVVPVVKYFFGIKPDASKNRITIAPQLPADWENGAKLTDVRVLDGTVSVEIYPKNGKIVCEVTNHTGASIEIKGAFEKVVK